MAKTTNADVLALNIKKRMEDLKLNKSELSRRTGLGMMTIRRVLDVESDPCLSTIGKIADVLGTSPSGLLK